MTEPREAAIQFEAKKDGMNGRASRVDLRHLSGRRLSAAERFEQSYMPEPNSGCWLWLGKSHDRMGYGTIKVGNSIVLAHRYSWALVHGEIPHGLFVCHKCDVPACVNPSHLFLGTATDNNADMCTKKRNFAAPGERNGNAKITAEQVAAIRASSRRIKDIVAEFGISRSMVHYIRAGTYWK